MSRDKKAPPGGEPTFVIDSGPKGGRAVVDAAGQEAEMDRADRQAQEAGRDRALFERMIGEMRIGGKPLTVDALYTWLPLAIGSPSFSEKALAALRADRNRLRLIADALDKPDKPFDFANMAHDIAYEPLRDLAIAALIVAGHREVAAPGAGQLPPSSARVSEGALVGDATADALRVEFEKRLRGARMDGDKVVYHDPGSTPPKPAGLLAWAKRKLGL